MFLRQARKGQDDQALNRSRGGFSTKIHLKTDRKGNPIAFCLSGGEASDSRHFDVLLDIGSDITPRAVVANKGYDAARNRKLARRRGICTVIPYRSNAKVRPKFFAKALYKARARIEQSPQKHGSVEVHRIAVPPILWECSTLPAQSKIII